MQLGPYDPSSSCPLTVIPILYRFQQPLPGSKLAEDIGVAPLLPYQQLTQANYLSNLATAEQSLDIAFGLLPIAISRLQKGRTGTI